MSVQALYSAATGMRAMEVKLDVIANNLANIDTTAFKRGRVNFEDLFYRHEKLPGAEDSAGGLTPTGISIGLGTGWLPSKRNSSKGRLKKLAGSLTLPLKDLDFSE